MGEYIGNKALKRLPQKSLNLIDGSISSHCSILNYLEWLRMIKQEKNLASVLCDIESCRLGEKEDRKKRDMEAEKQRRKKSKQNQMRDDAKRLKGLDTCGFLVRSVLAFGMDHSNNLKVKDLRFLLRYHFGSEKLKGSPQKVELVGVVEDFLERIGMV